MGKRWKVALWIALGILGGIQLIPVDRSNPPIESDIPAPPEVRSILKRSCYDCHSNETQWHWYSRIAPVSWLVAYDVHEGREALNFSTWQRYSAEEKAEKLEECWETVDEGEMPLKIYLLTHGEAALSVGDRNSLRQWTGSLAPR